MIEITLITFKGFYINANFSFLTDSDLSSIPVKRIYYMITFLCYNSPRGDSLGFYSVLALRRELFNCLTICTRKQYVIRIEINKDLHHSPCYCKLPSTCQSRVNYVKWVIQWLKYDLSRKLTN